MKMLRIIALAFLIAVSATSLATASPYSYVPRHGKPCRKGYRRVSRREHRRKRTTLIRICVKKRQPGSAIVPPQKQKRTILSARLNHSFIRNPEDPYEVSFDYGASAKQEETIEGQTLSVTSAEMPTGVLAFYSDGILECTENVGGTLEAANFCNVEYEELGQHKVTTIYTAGAESSAVSETVTIDPLETTTTLTVGNFERASNDPVVHEKELLGTLTIAYSTNPPGVVHLNLTHAGQGLALGFWEPLPSPSVVEVLLEKNYHGGNECPVTTPDCSADDKLTYEAVFRVGTQMSEPVPFSYLEDGEAVVTANRSGGDGYIGSSAIPSLLNLELESVRKGT